MQELSIVCKICGKIVSPVGMSSHIKYKHTELTNTKDYYDKYVKHSQDGICKVCGKPTKYIGLIKGYASHCSAKCGHSDKNTQLKRVNTCLDTYGVASATQSVEVKAKIKTSNLKTMQERYGVSCTLMLPEIRIKAATAVYDKYGKSGVFGDESVKNKIKQTNKSRYGHEQVFSCDLVKDKIKHSKRKSTSLFAELNNCTLVSDICDKYGGSWAQQKCFTDLYIIDKGRAYISNNYIEDIKLYMSVKHISNIEEDLFNFVYNLDESVIRNDKRTIYPFELDIFIPTHNLAIELNGIRWHSINNGKSIDYHLNKSKLCKDKDIRLIHIFEDEWNNKKDIFKSFIKHELNISANIIHSERCDIKELSLDIAIKFINNNSIMPNTESTYRIGLFYDNELVQLLCLNETTHNSAVITNMCTKQDFTIINGLQTLISAQPYNKLTVTIDYSKDNGIEYSNIGFNIVSKSAPNCFYSNPKNRIYEDEISIDSVKSLLRNKYIDTITVEQNLDNCGFYKIYDCGKIFMKYEKIYI